ncbi:unnamed protein product, partial [Iphiclides podalirius]
MDIITIDSPLGSYDILDYSDKQRKPWSIAATICIIVGTIFGMIAMVLYYRYFHSKGPIPWKYAEADIELNNKVSHSSGNNANKATSLSHVRSFKTLNKNKTAETSRNDTPVIEPASQMEHEHADKKFLLDHWIARSGSPTFTSAPVGNISTDASSIEIYSVENTPQLTVIKRDNSKIEQMYFEMN